MTALLILLAALVIYSGLAPLAIRSNRP